MSEEKNVFGLIAFSILLFVYFVGFILTVFDLRGGAFIGEFFLLILFIILALILIVGVYNRKTWAWGYSTFFFVINIINLLFIHFSVGGALRSVGLIFISALCFFISVINIKKPEEEILDVEAYDTSEETEKEEIVDKGVTKEFSPGKYVGSANGATYHSPKCNWAKKIKKSSQVWFDGRAEAKKKGYKKCNTCIK